MKKGLLLVTALLFISGVSMAQEVVVSADNRVFIDCRAMPAGAITKNKKARTIPAGNPDDVTNISSKESNKTVSHYFEVGKSDSASKTKYVTAVSSACASIADDGEGSWRLPTQRELQLVWILQQSLKAVDFTAFDVGYYWSATERNTTDCWVVRFSDGSTDSVTKTYGTRVRCVRDVTP